MAPTCPVPVEDAVAVIVKFQDHFSNGNFPAWSSDVWKQMSAALGNRWNFNCVYTNVTKNRRDIMTLARKMIGGTACTTHDRNNNPTSLEDSSTINSTTSESSNESDNDAACESFEEQRKRKFAGHETFDLQLTEDQWNSIKPITDNVQKKKKNTLKSGVWTNVIAMEFWRQYRFPCAFVFKDSYVGLSEDESSYVIKINGKCKSAACGNTFRGTAERNLTDAGILLKVDTRDTRTEQHELLKRPFNGELRTNAYKDLQAEGSAGYRKRLARENMQPGDTEPPFMPSATVARQAKKESRDADLGIKKGDGRDIIRTIENMTFDPKFYGVVHEVGSLPFHVFYSTQPQLTAYKEYCRLHKTSSTIIIDASGSVIHVFKRENGTTSGHIFLYTIVINFEFTTIAVEQMLSEKHDTEFITYWLKRWLRKGAVIPKEAVCDYSRALLCALSLAFNNITIKAYINCCFSSIFRGKANEERPQTRIRVDVAHLIHLICRWKCFSTASQTCIKDFFVRCVALMVECQTLDDFKQLFSLVCAVALQSHEDTRIDPSLAPTTKDARVTLEDCIAVRGVTAVFIQSRNKSVEDKKGEENIVDPYDSPLGPDESDIDISVGPWIDQQIELAKRILRPGKDLNPYYLPAFITQLSKLCKEFPLWSSVGMPRRTLHATSSYVEGYFNDIKTRVLGHTPLRVDAFMKIHARDIAGANFVFSSKIIQHNMKVLAENCKSSEPQPYGADDVSSFVEIETKVSSVTETKTEMSSFVGIESGVSSFVEIESDVSSFAVIKANECGSTHFDDSDLKSAENWRGIGGVPAVDETILSGHDDDSQLSNACTFDDPLSSTQLPLKLINDVSLHDSFLNDHSYSKINEEDINLNSWENKMLSTDFDILQPALNEGKNKSNNNGAAECTSTMNDVGNTFDSAWPIIKSFLDEKERPNSDARTVLDYDVASTTTKVESVPGNPILPIFNHQNASRPRKAVAKIPSRVPSKVTDVRSVPIDKILPIFNNRKAAKPNDEAAKIPSRVSSKTTDVRSISQEAQLTPNDAATKMQSRDPSKATDVLSISPEAQLTPIDKETTSIDEGTEKQLESTITKNSKYFKAYPEIRHTNTRVTKTKKPCLLPNGSNRRLVKINQTHYFVQNTCSFDSLVQMLMTAAIDNSQYFAYVEQSTNSTMKLVYNLIRSGLTQQVLIDRALILKSLFGVQRQVQTDERVLTSVVDVFCCIQTMVEKTLASEPSIHNIEECSHSGRRTYSQVLIAADFNPIIRSGFSALEKALNFRSPIYNVSCRRSECVGSFTWFREPGIHLLVMLDIRQDISCKRGITCTLKQIPVTLKLPVGDETSVEYRLAGVVGYMPGHYVAYCRRVTGTWQEYNDMKDKIMPCGERTGIEPHLALYIRI